MPAVDSARDGRFTAGAGTGDADIHRAHARFASLVGSGQRCLLGCEGSTLTGTAEAERTRTRPGDHVSDSVGEGDDRVVERRLNVNQPDRMCFFSLFLNVFFLVFAGAFAMSTSDLPSSCWPRCRGADPSGTRVGVSPLAADRQTAAVTQAAVRAHLDEPLDVQAIRKLLRNTLT